MRAGALVLFAVAAISARAEPPTLVGPRQRVGPEGFVIAVRPVAAELEVKGGVLEPLSGRDASWRWARVVPAGGVREVVLTAVSGADRAERRFEVGPRAATVSLSLVGERPTKNVDLQAELRVEVLGPDGKPDPSTAPPVLRANVGTLGTVERLGPGRFRVVYTLPTTRYPEVAMVVAQAAWPHPRSVHGALGVLRVPLASAIELPGETEPDADFSLTIAGKTFGPVRAGPKGEFRLPVVVPPGYGLGQGLAVDRVGNRRRVEVDLALPPTKQLACVAGPSELPANGTARARVVCATSDPFGNAAPGAKVTLAAKLGAIDGPRVLPNGLLEFGYRAPTDPGGGVDVLTASWRQQRVEATEAFEVKLGQGPATSLALQVAEPVLHVNGRLPVVVRAVDALGRPRPGVTVAVEAGRVTASQTDAGTVLEPRGHEVGRTTAVLVASGPFGEAPAAIAVGLEARGVVAQVVDLAGLPVRAQTLQWGDGGAGLTDGRGEVVLAPSTAVGELVVRHAEWPDLAATVVLFGAGREPFTELRRSPPARAELPLFVAPPAPLVVRTRVEGLRVEAWCERPADGAEVPCTLSVAAYDRGKIDRLRQEHGRTVFELAERLGSFSVREQATGVTAVFEVRP